MGIRILAVVVMILASCATGQADEMSVESVFGAFERGGKIMWAILLVSMIGCAFAVERLLAVRRGVQIPKRLMAELRDAMVSGGVAAGRKVVDGDRSAMGRVMYALLSRSGATRRELETTVDDEASRILYDLRANLRPIGVIASISPLLGLLGTVFGLIAAFRTAAELGMDDPRNFAEGIYEALYTTAFGLVVAIPMLVVYHIMRNYADNIMREVEERALAFISAASNRADRASPGRQSTSSGHAGQERDERSHSGLATGEQEPVSSTRPGTAAKTAAYDRESERAGVFRDKDTRADDDETSVDDK